MDVKHFDLFREFAQIRNKWRIKTGTTGYLFASKNAVYASGVYTRVYLVCICVIVL